MRIFYYSLFGFLFLIFSCTNSDNRTNNPKEEMDSNLVLIGTYTQKEGHVDGKSDGLYLAELNRKTGSLEVIDTIIGIKNPSYVSIHPNGKNFYAVSEIAGSDPIGRVFAYQIDKKTRKIKFINDVLSFGNAPCHLSIDPNTNRLYVVNYMGGIINYKLAENGGISPDPQIINYEGGVTGSARQEAPHPHMIEGDGQSVFVTDLGANILLTFQSNESGKINQVSRTEMLPETGPRHFALHPTNNKVYITNELSNTIEVFERDSKSLSMKRLQNINGHGGLRESSNRYASAIKIHPKGKFLYSAIRAPKNSKDNAIHLFHIDEQTGTLIYKATSYSHGDVPRDFEISPTGKYLLLANQNSDNIITFEINEATGELSESVHNLEVKTPVCIKFF